MRSPFRMRRHPEQSLAERRPVVDEVEPAPSWDGSWTQRPPSTLQAEIAAIHDAHVAWVLGLPNGGGVIPTDDQDIDVQPYIVPEAS